MSFLLFKNINQEHQYLGGKAYALGLLSNAGFPVPPGAVLSDRPKNESEWNEIFSWWESIHSPLLAIRSSATGEDSSDQSFAGQNSTFLNIKGNAAIKKSVEGCFLSLHKKSSSLYREHFMGDKRESSVMNVVLQTMVDPAYSGVFFSLDPRTNKAGWIVEAIEGLGEDLVSGKKTPYHFEENNQKKTKLFNLEEVVEYGIKVKKFFNYEIDMEWAVDKNGNFFVLQARPITALSGKSEEKRLIDEELKRLKKTHHQDTIWDGQTFAEWSGPPTELTFSLWKEAFSKNHALSKALKKLGYLGINKELPNDTHSLLEKIFGRAYINLSMMAPLYFGPMPYTLHALPHPHLKFDWRKISKKGVAQTPVTIMRMLKVGWRLSTERKEWINQCAKELTAFHARAKRPKNANYYEKYSDDELIKIFKKESYEFYDEHLVWPLILITLIESTTHSLNALLKGVYPREQIHNKVNEWLAHGIHTVTMDMNNEYKKAACDKNLRAFFMERFGHRGPGELELSHPRWCELSDKSFFSPNKSNSGTTQLTSDNEVIKEIQNLKTLKKQAIEKEWLLLKEMLELRERFKMALLFPYAHLRFLALEIGKRNNLGDLIFWHEHIEISTMEFNKARAKKRKENAALLKSISLPSIISLNQLETILTDKPDLSSKVINGVALSQGLVYGEIRVVTNPEEIDTNNWPDNTILVAESTDPGWTGLFIKSKAVIVEKGGVLSHCAIVAREMNLPAVSEIKQCHLRFKDGDKVWVDGNNGRVTLA